MFRELTARAKTVESHAAALATVRIQE